MGDFADDRVDFLSSDFMPRRSHRPTRSSWPGDQSRVDYYPVDDAACKEILLRLGHFKAWSAKRVSSRYEEHPHRLQASFDDCSHTIYIPNRTGSVYAWLRIQQDFREED